MTGPAPTAASPWPPHGGACGALIRNHDWAATGLGPIDGWSPVLKATVANVVNSPVAQVLMWGGDHVMLYNDAYAEIAGANHPRALGGTVPGIWPEIWDWNKAVLEAGFAGEQRLYREQPLTLERAGATEELTFDLFYAPVYEIDGTVGGVLCTCIDGSAQVSARRALAASDTRFRTAIDAIHGVLWTNSPEGRMTGEQPGWAALTGQAPAEYQDFGWAAAVHPDDAPGTIEAWEAALAARGMFVHEHRVRDRHGAWRSFAIRGLPVLDPAGEIVEWVGVHTDITHQRAAEASLRGQADKLARQVRHRERAEQQLRLLNETLEARVVAEIDERRQAEAKLAQAQKMETIGQLTGGVAHDFNNLLQVVSGNLQLLAADVAGTPRAEQRVANAMAGVQRGAKLASQLLAFGRRQALEPRVLNLARLVRGMDDLLRRAIGEGIEVETVVGGGLWNTYVDPAQIENAILNLAINARDAMDGAGKLTVEIGNASLDADYARAHHGEVQPGQYVVLAVTDTGTGMSPEVVDKVFEPFFSTKAEGKGSGLGLSMVYGLVKQSGGHIKIYSEIGEGTTIRLYLPRAIGSEDVEVQAQAGPIVGGSETVLVVEDDEEVRATVVAMLNDLGYRTLTAPDAGAALIVIESGVPVDVLFTDVVMPGPLKSPELARKVQERLPHVAVLFTSGYTENSIVHGGKLDAGVELLSKPYTREALARRFRHVIGNAQQRRIGRDAAAASIVPSAGDAADAASSDADETLDATVLLVEDDALIRGSTADMLRAAGASVTEAGDVEQALATLGERPVDLLVTDFNLPGGSGVALATRVAAISPRTAIVYATGDAAGAREGAVSGSVVLAKPFTASQLLAAARAALSRRG